MSGKPRVLWIPHTSWSQCKAQRQWFLIQELASRYEIHVLTWAARPASAPRTYYLNPVNYLRAFHTGTVEHGFGYVHDAGVPLPVFRLFCRGYPPEWLLALRQRRFQHNIRKLHSQWKFAAMIAASSHHYTG